MTFSSRLQVIMRDGNLTVADLARWFDKPYPTVNTWIKGGRLGGPPRDRESIMHEIDQLEKLIRQNKKLPVPRMPLSKRAQYLAKIKGA